MLQHHLIRFMWSDIASTTSFLVPPLLETEHKGSMGRIGVIGGSKDFSGAPYYAAVSALKFGADLSWVYCSKSASLPIKSYSPELMVTPFYDDFLYEDNITLNYDEIFRSASSVSTSISRTHSLVIGPGLGRSSYALAIVAEVIKSSKGSDKALVIDADGLWLITKNLSLITGHPKCILTPNQIEFDRLVNAAVDSYSHALQHIRQLQQCDNLIDAQSAKTANECKNIEFVAHFIESVLHDLRLPVQESDWTNKRDEDCVATGADTTYSSSSSSSSNPAAMRIRALSIALGGVTIMKKGCEEWISAGDDVFVIHTEAKKRSPRRSGGQGDILAGNVGVAYHWALQRRNLLPNIRGIMKESTLPSEQLVSEDLNSKANSSNTRHIGNCFLNIDAAIATLTRNWQVFEGSSGEDRTGTTDSIHSMRSSSASIHACIFASAVTKQASLLAYQDKGRSMTAPDVIERIGKAFEDIYIDDSERIK